MPRRILSCFAAILLLFLFNTASSEDIPKVLRVSAIPDENPTELLRIYTPIVKYLEKEIGIPVEFTPVIDYAATVEGMAADKLDLVWFGGLTHVQARIRTNQTAYAIAMREEDLKFKSVFITNSKAKVKSLEELKGKTFAFGSAGSTSGHTMPRYFLLQAGTIPERDFAKFAFSGSHDATAKWVESERVDAGALNISVWEKLIEIKQVDTSKVFVFWTTPPYVDYNWTVRGNLDKGLVEKIKQAFLKLDGKNPEHAEVLKLHRATRYIPVPSEEIFKPIEEAARQGGLIK
ncbi:MAG: putative selenate ABC transporter substrate-binding protein [Candidatus Tectomicrobia bacterium]|nr:putative selenate ABC transporter substrate-binding protein [Candidatus Tectomicrobia bacterium]